MVDGDEWICLSSSGSPSSFKMLAKGFIGKADSVVKDFLSRREDY